ncbi:MAG: DUF2948 family protein [Parvibaculaceae bacterium]|nr:DUF2948 family protein [Parvibaculaceae bacterium]
MTGLRLLAEDMQDLEIISAHLQDAVGRTGDLAYLPSRRRFALIVNRFRWEIEKGGRRHGHQRVRTGLHFDNVLRVRSRNIDHDQPNRVLSLLAVRFEETDAPSGRVILVFAGGAEILLEVEALDVHLSDIGQSWETPNVPAHPPE